MRPVRVVVVALGGLLMLSAPAVAQRSDDSFKWYLGAQAGVLGFETPSQTRGWAPTVGGQLLVMAKRTGLLVAIDEAFGNNEVTGYGDVNANAGVREVLFDRIRRYSATLTAYPVKGSTQPYFGLGFGLMQVLDPKPQGVFTSPIQARLAGDLAATKSTDGFISAVAGVQFRAGRMVAFGQAQLSSSAQSGHLLRGAGQAITGGLRFSLGGAKEGVRGGGY